MNARHLFFFSAAAVSLRVDYAEAVSAMSVTDIKASFFPFGSQWSVRQ